MDLRTEKNKALDNFPRCSCHIYQDHFKSFPIQDGSHFLDGDALRRDQPVAGSVGNSGRGVALVEVARPKLATWPRDENWRESVNAPLTEAGLDLLRRNVVRGTPFGLPDWVLKLSAETGMESTLRPRGRPRKLVSEE
jgi:putative transposase